MKITLSFRPALACAAAAGSSLEPPSLLPRPPATPLRPPAAPDGHESSRHAMDASVIESELNDAARQPPQPLPNAGEVPQPPRCPLGLPLPLPPESADSCKAPTKLPARRVHRWSRPVPGSASTLAGACMSTAASPERIR